MEQELIKFIVDYRDKVLWDKENSYYEESRKLFFEGEEFALRKIEAKIRELLKHSNKPTQEQINDFWEDK